MVLLRHSAPTALSGRRLRAQFAVLGEIVPEEHGRVPPAPGLPAAEERHAVRAGIQQAQRERAVERVLLRQRRVRHEQPFEARLLAMFIHPAVPAAARIFDRPGDRDLRRRGPGVRDAVTQHRHREARIVRFVGDKRRERFERNPNRQRAVRKIDARQRKLAGERRGGQPHQPGSVLRSEPRRAFVGRLYARLQHACHRLRAAGLRPDAGERVVRRRALVGLIEDLPVAKLSAPAQADGSGSDAAQRECQHLEVAAGEHSRIRNVRRGRRWASRSCLLRLRLGRRRGKRHPLQKRTPVAAHGQ